MPYMTVTPEQLVAAAVVVSIVLVLASIAVWWCERG